MTDPPNTQFHRSWERDFCAGELRDGQKACRRIVRLHIRSQHWMRWHVRAADPTEKDYALRRYQRTMRAALAIEGDEICAAEMWAYRQQAPNTWRDLSLVEEVLLQEQLIAAARARMPKTAKAHNEKLERMADEMINVAKAVKRKGGR